MNNNLDVTLEEHREFGLNLRKISGCVSHYYVVIACLTTNGAARKTKIDVAGNLLAGLRYQVFDGILYKQFPGVKDVDRIYSPRIGEEDEIYNKHEWDKQYKSLMTRRQSRKAKLAFMVAIAPDIAKDLREFSEYINMVCNRMGPAMNKENMAEAQKIMKILENTAVYIETLSFPPTEQ